ncbi:hypothetical protein [Streptomyces physcomitrii]|uniref:Uncharacterized protein n=1 Tax=Streptomyces physcomitrii TaxID=2724184 RepID=A0ABX1H6A0_9ACTN|nr:hypothetical protein [Streptomyces physcomitrii]NKI42835.1 hypothetical protein [Streptomyces physcomitrii]
MTGSTPPRKRFFRGRQEAEGDQSGGARDDERGQEASLAPAPSAASGDSPDSGTGAALERVADERADLDRPSGSGGRGAAVKKGVRRGGSLAKAGIGHLADRLIETAPRIPVRDLATLRRHFPGLGPEEIADKLVAGAANGTSTVGAGIGAAAMLPVPPAMPAELAAEVSGVALIELKLIAELYEVYGQRPEGNLKERSVTYLNSWSEERGIDVTKPSTFNAALGGQMKRELRQQIMKRMVRNLPNLMPFMVGATVGAMMNRRDTRKLAERIRKDLRRRQVPWEALAGLDPLEQPPAALDLTDLPPELGG